MNAYLEKQTSGNNWLPDRHTVYRSGADRYTAPSKPLTELESLDVLERQMAEFAKEHEASIQKIRENFVLQEDTSVTAFLTDDRRLPQTLLEAAGHLKECFGAETVLRLGITSDEAGSRALYAAAIWPGSVKTARAALAKFDDWWLAKPRLGSGYLTFTYELV